MKGELTTPSAGDAGREAARRAEASLEEVIKEAATLRQRAEELEASVSQVRTLVGGLLDQSLDQQSAATTSARPAKGLRRRMMDELSGLVRA